MPKKLCIFIDFFRQYVKIRKTVSSHSFLSVCFAPAGWPGLRLARRKGWLGRYGYNRWKPANLS